MENETISMLYDIDIFLVLVAGQSLFNADLIFKDRGSRAP